MATWQIMHTKSRERITELLNERGTANEFEIVVRNEIARELFNALPQEEKNALEEEVDEQFAKVKAKYDAGADGLATPSKEDQLE